MVSVDIVYRDIKKVAEIRPSEFFVEISQRIEVHVDKQLARTFTAYASDYISHFADNIEEYIKTLENAFEEHKNKIGENIRKLTENIEKLERAGFEIVVPTREDSDC